MLQVSKCLIGLAVMMLQSCETVDNRRDLLCGNWESVEGKPDVLIYKEGEAYKVTVFKRSGLRRKLKPETYLLQEENGNLFMSTGFRIDVLDICNLNFKCYFYRISPIQPPTPSRLSALIFPYTGVSSLGKNKNFFSSWCPTRPVSSTYAAGAMGLSMCTFWMVV